MTKQERINKILDDAGEALKAEGVKYFLGVVDRQPKAPDGGRAYVQSDISGEEFGYILDMALQTSQDLVHVGIQLGRLITARKRAQKEKGGKK